MLSLYWSQGGSFPFVSLTEASVNTDLSVTLMMLAKPSIICISGLTACWTIPAIPASMLFCLSLLQPSDTHLLAPLLIGVKACILYLWVQSTQPLCLSPICFEGLQRHVKSSECSCGLAQPSLSGVLSACRTSSFPETHPSSLLL